MLRTIENGKLRLEHVDQPVELVGWVARKRNFGQLVFIDLRDRTGICQLVFDERFSEPTKKIRNEYVIHVHGVVEKRKDINPDLETGEVEVKVTFLEVINSAKTTPMIVADETDALEDTRLKYRYLDLRRPIMQQRLMMRHRITRSMREYLDTHDFIEIETPMLGKSTPEGARDYLVPSRVHPGAFYALPQSPQLYKQLLMISGFERYYQFARCFRDEDLRADRQTDFTQVDIETSFLSEVEIQTMMEEMMVKLMKEVKGIEIKTPFLRLTYAEAMNTYGSDKPDIRFGMKLRDITDVFRHTEFNVFKSCIASHGSIKAIVVPEFGSISRKQIDAYTNLAKKNGAKGLVVLKANDHEMTGAARKFLSDEEVQNLYSALRVQDNSAVFIVSDDWLRACTVLGVLRNAIAAQKGYKEKSRFAFLWVTDFPMFEWNEEEQRYTASHHPFTQPKQDDIPLLDSDIEKVRANAYDIVLNGYELGGGSLRIHDNQLQKKIFSILGLSDAEIRDQFGFFIDAFEYGTPSHGGIAFGLDRIAMIVSESDSIRDVIAFPKNASASDPMSKAPSPVDKKQLDALHISLAEKAK